MWFVMRQFRERVVVGVVVNVADVYCVIFVAGVRRVIWVFSVCC